MLRTLSSLFMKGEFREKGNCCKVKILSCHEKARALEELPVTQTATRAVHKQHLPFMYRVIT